MTVSNFGSTFSSCGIYLLLLHPVVGLAQEQPKPGPSEKVQPLRIPHNGIQPQAMVDAEGIIHLIYFAGEPSAGDVFYVRSAEGKHFSSPLRVNSQLGSAIAVGNIRGGHLAVGKAGRVHVAWMGSGKAEPRGPDKATPMLYARLNDAGTAFEPQRNVIHKAYGLDGGGSIAADEGGNVYVAWHAPLPGTHGEENRCVWVARSTDEGKSLVPETRANADPTGVCGCCGMRAFAARDGSVSLLYRSAHKQVHRDTYLLISTDHAANFRSLKLHEWNLNTCPMSSMFLTGTATTSLAAWETNGQVYFSSFDSHRNVASSPLFALGSSQDRKHPVVARNSSGEMILAWTEGMGWNRGGSLHWQVFDKDGKPTSIQGKLPGVPTWSLVAVFAGKDGNFTVVY